MKKLLMIVCFFLSLQAVNAQGEKVRSRDLEGVWKMRIVLDENTFQDEADEEENAFARMIVQATGNLVEGILENIDIEIEFLEDHTCRVYVEAFGAEEVEYSKWFINSKGELYIDDTDSFHMDDDEYWMFEEDVLVAYDDRGRSIDDDVDVYMVRKER